MMQGPAGGEEHGVQGVHAEKTRAPFPESPLADIRSAEISFGRGPLDVRQRGA